MQKVPIISLVMTCAVAAISNSQTSQAANTCTSVLPGGCYTKPATLTQDIVPLKQAVPMKAGLWQDELLDAQGKPEANSAVQSCRLSNDWRKHALAAGEEAGEGCTKTMVIARTRVSGATSINEFGTSDTCRLDREITSIVGWVRPISPVNEPLKKYEMVSTTTLSYVPKVGKPQLPPKSEVTRTLHTWLGECLPHRK